MWQIQPSREVRNKHAATQRTLHCDVLNRELLLNFFAVFPVAGLVRDDAVGLVAAAARVICKRALVTATGNHEHMREGKAKTTSLAGVASLHVSPGRVVGVSVHEH